MTEEQLKLVGAVVEDYSAIKTESLINFKKINEESIQNFDKKRYEHFKKTVKWLEEIVEEFPSVAEKANEANRATGIGFNALSFFDIGETKHSFLLAHLLSPYKEHGQGNLFLKKFLELIQIESPDKGHWVVTAEKRRIDILLRRNNPPSIVIIENKSNNAGDQPNQLYRYWYHQIYKNNQQHGYYYAQKHPEKYRIIYLPPSAGKQPNENSLRCPADWKLEDPNIPDMVPVEISRLSFSDFVVTWLENCVREIPLENFRLREYVKQYIEIWK